MSRTVRDAHRRIDEIEPRVTKLETEVHIQFKEVFTRIKRLETILIGAAGTIIAMLVAILSQYKVAEGREEVTEMQPTGEQVFNEDTMEMEDVMHEVVVQSAIEPVEPTVEQTVYSDDMDAEPTIEIVTNPLIVQDVLEREAAQAVVDGTPDAVKED